MKPLSLEGRGRAEGPGEGVAWPGPAGATLTRPAFGGPPSPVKGEGFAAPDFWGAACESANMALEMINIGFGNCVASSRVVVVVRADSSPLRRLIENAAAENRLIDATSGRKTRSILVTDSHHVILSHQSPAVIRDKLLGRAEAMAEDEESP